MKRPFDDIGMVRRKHPIGNVRFAKPVSHHKEVVMAANRRKRNPSALAILIRYRLALMVMSVTFMRAWQDGQSGWRLL